MMTQRSPKAANTQQSEEDTQQLNQFVCEDKKNVFPSTFNHDSLEGMKKQLLFLQEQLEQEEKKRIALEMRHSQLDRVGSTPNRIEVKRSVPSPNKSSIKPCKPKSFEGNLNENALLWVNSMQRYLELSNAPEEFWIKTSASYLQSNALLWFENYLISNNVCETDLIWSEFKEQFLTRFQPVMATQQAHSRLMNWKHTSDIEQYINGFLNLSAQVPFNVVGELGRIDYFIENLKPYVKRFVQMTKPQTLQQAIVAARETAATFETSSRYESTPKTSSSRTKSNTSNYRRTMSHTSSVRPSMQLDNTMISEEDEWNEIEGERPTYDNSDDSAFNLSQLSEENKILYRTGKCFTCKEQGHISKQCPERKKELKKRYRNNLKF